MSGKSDTLPRKVLVKALVSSRYDDLYSSHKLVCGGRPESWDDRVAGTDIIKTEEGEQIILQSNGQQSPPIPGHVLMLQDGDSARGFSWTLYGLKS